MPVWEIYTYGNGEFLAMIFNGVVALLGDSNFTTLMRLAGIFGLMWVSIKAALYRGPVEWTYLIWFVVIYGVLFVPKVDVVIVDRLDSSQTRVVANVPWGLGTFAGTTARIGDWFTRGTEAVMTLPDDLKYQRNGVVFGSSLIEAASQYEITDGRFSANMSEFMRQCVFYDVLFRRYTWTDILEAEDTWEFIRTHTAPVSRSFSYSASDGSRSIIPCRTGALGVLTADWNVELDRAQRLYGIRFNPHLTMAEAAAKLMADIPVSYDYLAGISRSGGDIVRANMMANLFRRSFGNAAAAADAGAAAQDFALAQAERQQLQTYQVMGKLAGKLLPLLKNIYEGLLYGMFPFLFLVFMLPIGVKIFLAYLKNIVWLQLWAPLYAILNLLMTLGAQKFSTAAAAQLGGQALSLATHSGLAYVNTETAVIAGYIGLSIPLIAYGLVSGGQMALTQLAAQVGAVAQVAANQASSSASTGNINLATLGAYNTGMFKNDTHAATNYGGGRLDSGSGVIDHFARHGQWVSMEGGMPVAAGMGGAARNEVNARYTESMEAARSELADYGRSVNADYQNMLRFQHEAGRTISGSTQFSRGDLASHGQQLAETESLANRWGAGRGYSTNQSMEMLATASVVAQNPKLLDLVSPVSLKAELGMQHASDAKVMEDFRSAMEYAKQTNFADTWQSTVDSGQRLAADFSDRTGDSLGRDIAGGLRSSETTSARLSATLNEAHAWQQANSRIEESGASWDADLIQAVRRDYIGRHGSFGPESFDMLLTQAKSGDLTAIDRLATLSREYVQNNAEHLAGIQGAPTRDGVEVRGRAGLDELREMQTRVRGSSKGMEQTPYRAAETSGVRPSEAIKARSQFVANLAGDKRTGMEEQVTPSVGGDTLAGNVDERVENGQWTGHQLIDAGQNSFIPKSIGDLHQEGNKALTGEYQLPEGSNAQWRTDMAGETGGSARQSSPPASPMGSGTGGTKSAPTYDYGKMPDSALLRFASSDDAAPEVRERAREELEKRGFRFPKK